MPVALGNPLALLALVCAGPVVWLAGRSFRRLTPSRRTVTTGVRLLGLLLLTLALAAFRLQRPTDAVATVFLLDESASMRADARREAQAFVRQAVRAARPGDRFAVTAFGNRPVIVRGWGTDSVLGDLRVDIDGSTTHIAESIEVALAMLPDRQVGRIVVIGDGAETRGDAGALTGLVRWQGATVDVVPIVDRKGADPAVLDVTVPAVVEPGAPVPIRIALTSNAVSDVTLRVFRNGAFWVEERLTLIDGVTSRVYEDTAADSGATLYRVQIDAARDVRPENNEGLGLVRVDTPPQVWLVDVTGTGSELAGILDARGLSSAVVSPASLPDSAAAYAGVRSVVLNDIPAAALTQVQQEALASAVREFGVGVLMLGSTDSFGPGGWRHSPVEDVLPVTMESTRPREGTVGIVLVIDVSGSMSVLVDGQPRLRFAQEAALSAYATADEDTLLGVVAFSSTPMVALPLRPRPQDVDSITPQLRRLRAEGGTLAAPAIRMAIRMLTQSDATTRHIIFMTDGAFGDNAAVDPLIPALQSANITLSTIGAGPGIDADRLRRLADAADGIFYPYTRAAALPAFFAEDTMQIVRNPIVRGPLLPVPLRAGAASRGVDWGNAPLMDAMISTTARESAEVLVSSPDQDPLVATWRVGLATTTVLCTDLGGDFTPRWRQWQDRAALFDALVRSTLPPLNPAGFSAELRLDRDQAEITADAIDATGAFINGLELVATIQDPGGRAQTVPLRQVGPGQYRARVTVAGTGLFTAQVRDTSAADAGRQWLSVARAYPPELAPRADGSALLYALAGETGGQVLKNPSEAFRRPEVPKTVHTDLWPWLTAFALCLFPVDIALRRFAGGWRMPRLPVRAPAPAVRTSAVKRAPAPTSDALVGVGVRGGGYGEASAGAGTPSSPAPEPPMPADSTLASPEVQSTTSRLLAARRKAQQDQDVDA